MYDLNGETSFLGITSVLFLLRYVEGPLGMNG